MRNLVFCFALLVLSPSVFADVVEVKPLGADVVIKAEANEAKLFDVDPKRRQVVLTSTGVYLIEKQSTKSKLFGKKCGAK